MWKSFFSGAIDKEAPAVIIAADTIVTRTNDGTPEKVRIAVSILTRMKNTYHFVATGVALVRPGAQSVLCFTIKPRFFQGLQR
jgi:predicted house-cleaning NTP pyrophosphatase (Maf/HAM1 superfamily)